jgi:hypothetical protein
MLLYFGAWWGALAAGIVATIALVVWIIACCVPCITHFWNCCVFLQWQFIANSLLVTLFGIVGGISGGNGIVTATFGAALVVIGAAMGAAKCSTPNPFYPPSWPPCRCGP